MTEHAPRDKRCEEFELLMMRHFDKESSPEEESRLQEHVKSCPSCARRMREYETLIAATDDLDLPEVPPEQWDLYWTNVYNRLERKTAWVVVAAALGVAVAYGLLRLALLLYRAPNLSACVKVAISALVAGLTLLFISVLREKLILRKTDKYRGVIR